MKAKLKKISAWLFCLLFLVLVALPLLALDEREDTQYQLIVNLYSQNAYAMALEQVAKFNQDFPDSSLGAQVSYLSARLDQERGYFAVAQQKYEAFLKKYSGNKLRADVYFALGETQYRQKNYQAALINFQLLQNEFPNSNYVAEAMFWTAETAFSC